MLLIDKAFSQAVSDSALLEPLVVFFLAGLAFFAILAFLVTGGMSDSTSRVVKRRDNLVMLLLWPKISNAA